MKMANDKNKGFHEVDEQNLDSVAGGYVGKDKYTAGQYNEAGVSWQHNIWSKDKYYYKGKPISQKEAEKITDVYKLNK